MITLPKVYSFLRMCRVIIITRSFNSYPQMSIFKCHQVLKPRFSSTSSKWEGNQPLISPQGITLFNNSNKMTWVVTLWSSIRIKMWNSYRRRFDSSKVIHIIIISSSSSSSSSRRYRLSIWTLILTTKIVTLLILIVSFWSRDSTIYKIFYLLIYSSQVLERE